MKKVWFIFMLMFSVILIMYGQDDPYSKPVEQKAIKMAYDILNVYYPGNILCITDSIYDHDWFGLSGVIDKETDEIIMSYRIEKNSNTILRFIPKVWRLCLIQTHANAINTSLIFQLRIKV